MQNLVQLLISGLATGAIYALMAIGFSLLWQTSQTINFAQGQFVMLPAFLILAAMRFLHLPFGLAVLLGGGASVLVLGLLFKRLFVDPMQQHGVLALVIATIALGHRDRAIGQDLLQRRGAALPGPGVDRRTCISAASSSRCRTWWCWRWRASASWRCSCC